MKAYLIDPYAQTVTETEWDGDWKTIAPTIEAEHFDVATFSENGDGVFVDDMGYFREGQRFYSIRGYSNPLGGKGLVLGLNSHDGESIEPTLSLDDMQSRVTFYGTCDLCGAGLRGLGSNGLPVVDGRVCSDCDQVVVLQRLVDLEIVKPPVTH